jgi:hypothetical protein
MSDGGNQGWLTDSEAASWAPPADPDHRVDAAPSGSPDSSWMSAPPPPPPGPQFAGPPTYPTGGGWELPPSPAPYGAAPGWLPPPLASGSAGQGPSRRAATVLGVVAAVEAVVIFALAAALVGNKSSARPTPLGTTIPPSGSFSPDQGQVVFSSSFGPNDGWPTGAITADTNATLSNGQYVVDGTGSIHHIVDAPYRVAQADLSLTADVASYPDQDGSFGLGCKSAYGLQSALVYQVVVDGNGDWYLEEGRLGGAVDTLISGTDDNLNGTARLALVCAMTSAYPNVETQLAVYLDGTQVGAVGDQIGKVDIGGFVPVLVTGTYGTEESVTYSSLSERTVGLSS